jgi:hypothetical protein
MGGTVREDLTPRPAGGGLRGWRQPEHDGAATVDVIGVLCGERGTPGAHEALAGLVRRMMVDCRARLVAEAAVREASGTEAARDGCRELPEAPIPAQESASGPPACA